MARFEWSTINEKLVLKQDFSTLSGEELMKALQQSHLEIKSKGNRKIVVITNIRDLKFDRHVTKAFEELSEKNKPYVAESAIFGVGTIQKVAIESVGRITGRHYNIYREEKDVQAWLESL